MGNYDDHDGIGHLDQHRRAPVSTPMVPEIPFREYRPRSDYPGGWQPRECSYITSLTIKPQTLRDHTPPPHDTQPALHQLPSRLMHGPQQLAAGSAEIKERQARKDQTDAAYLGVKRYGREGARMRVCDHVLRILQEAGTPMHTSTVAEKTLWSRDAVYHGLRELLDGGRIKRRLYRRNRAGIGTTHSQWALLDAEWPPLPADAQLVTPRRRPALGRSAA